MNEKTKQLDESGLDALCKHVCSQMTVSHSREIDRETLYFAIYWKICDYFEAGLSVSSSKNSKISAYRDGLLDIYRKFNRNTANCLEVVDRNVDNFIFSKYPVDTSPGLDGKRAARSKTILPSHSIAL